MSSGRANAVSAGTDNRPGDLFHAVWRRGRRRAGGLVGGAGGSCILLYRSSRRLLFRDDGIVDFSSNRHPHHRPDRHARMPPLRGRGAEGDSAAQQYAGVADVAAGR